MNSFIVCHIFNNSELINVHVCVCASLLWTMWCVTLCQFGAVSGSFFMGAFIVHDYIWCGARWCVIDTRHFCRYSFNLYIFEFEMRRKQNRLNTLTCCTTSKRMKTTPVICVWFCVFPFSRINATELDSFSCFTRGAEFILPNDKVHIAQGRTDFPIPFHFVCQKYVLRGNSRERKIAIWRDDRCSRFIF